MDVGHTYASNKGVRLAVYVAPGYEPPEVVQAAKDGGLVEFFRVSDRSLECGTVAQVRGACTNHECHRAALGKCQCGRHEFGVGISKAAPGDWEDAS